MENPTPLERKPALLREKAKSSSSSAFSCLWGEVEYAVVSADTFFRPSVSDSRKDLGKFMEFTFITSTKRSNDDDHQLLPIRSVKHE